MRGANPVRLVICLYEQAIDDLRRALLALEKNDIETRTREINHALMVIAQLQGSLDKQRGADVASNLDVFYNQVRAGLVEAQFKQSASLLEQQISHLSLVHEAWLEVERVTQTSSAQSQPQSQPQSPTPPVSAGETPFADWNA